MVKEREHGCVIYHIEKEKGIGQGEWLEEEKERVKRPPSCLSGCRQVNGLRTRKASEQT